MTLYDILPEVQAALLPRLAAVKTLGYALYGGTAIALQIGHRQSVDFDFFSSQALDEGRLVNAMPLLADATTLQRDPDTWTVLVSPVLNGQPVKLSFFGGLEFGRVGRPVLSRDGEVVMASLDDLLGHKLKVVLQRVEAKDYQDIAALIGAGLAIERGLGAATALFPRFPAAEALRAMTYFEGGDLDRLSQRDRAILVRIVAHAGSPTPMTIIARDLVGMIG